MLQRSDIPASSCASTIDCIFGFTVSAPHMQAAYSLPKPMLFIVMAAFSSISVFFARSGKGFMPPSVTAMSLCPAG